MRPEVDRTPLREGAGSSCGRRARRRFLAHLAAWPLAAALPSLAYETKPGSRLKIMMKSAWGSDDPTKAAFPFSHAAALAEAGHEVQIFLLGEAVVLMRRVVAEAVTPVGWPRVSELLAKVAERKIPIYACGTRARARGVGDQDLANWGAQYGNPKIFVSLVEWADRIITE
jgi:predicted peroxiredoxin